MEDQQQHLEEVKAFIHEHRSNEGNFQKLHTKLEEECRWAEGQEGLSSYAETLSEVRDKTAEAYRQNREASGSAWPEFEKYVTGFEKAVTLAMKE